MTWRILRYSGSTHALASKKDIDLFVFVHVIIDIRNLVSGTKFLLNFVLENEVMRISLLHTLKINEWHFQIRLLNSYYNAA